MEKDFDKQSTGSSSADSCQVRDALLIIGGKWKSMILHALSCHDAIRFNQLRLLIPGISQKMLTQQLRELERDGLISREAFAEIPPRVEYSITELGSSIGDIYKQIHLWQKMNYAEIERKRIEYDRKTRGA